MPEIFGRTHDSHQSPHVGSVVQTIGAVIVTAIFAGLGLDPILNMFTWISQIGTLGVIGMMCMTSISVIMFFRKSGKSGSVISTLILPALVAVIMASLFVYIFANFGDLIQTPNSPLAPDSALPWLLPSLIPLGAVIGLLLAARLKSTNPARFAKMGQNRI